VKMTYRNSLERAREAQLEAVALSLLSAGVLSANRRLVDVLRLGIEVIRDFDIYPELSEVHASICIYRDGSEFSPPRCLKMHKSSRK